MNWHVSQIPSRRGMPVVRDELHRAVCTFPRQSANWQERAKLIAAAPELAAELARMVEHFGEFANNHSMDATAETWAALHCARAILAKATAGAP